MVMLMEILAIRILIESHMFLNKKTIINYFYSMLQSEI